MLGTKEKDALNGCLKQARILHDMVCSLPKLSERSSFNINMAHRVYLLIADMKWAMSTKTDLDLMDWDSREG